MTLLWRCVFLSPGFVISRPVFLHQFAAFIDPPPGVALYLSPGFVVVLVV
jgi:hypothetical protein